MTIRDAHGLDSLVLFAFIDICEGVNHWSHGSTGPETKDFGSTTGCWGAGTPGTALPGGGGAKGVFTISLICGMTLICERCLLISLLLYVLNKKVHFMGKMLTALHNDVDSPLI
jgi:hypothetical protein